jgi:hypothetical protein
MFCAPGLVFGGLEGDESSFNVLRARTHFRRKQGRRVPFSSIALPESFLAIPWALGHILMFCAPELVSDGTEGVRSCFHVSRARTRFLRYRGCRVPFSCIVLPDSFSAIPRASGPVFMFCTPGLIFGGTEGVGSRFHVLRSHTHFRRYRGRQVPFSCFALLDSFSTVARASGPVFMICAPGLVFGGTVGVGSRFHVFRARTNLGSVECVGSHFHVLRAQTRFPRCRVCRVPFSCFACPDSFSAVPRGSGLIFMFCAP